MRKKGFPFRELLTTPPVGRIEFGAVVPGYQRLAAVRATNGRTLELPLSADLNGHMEERPLNAESADERGKMTNGQAPAWISEIDEATRWRRMVV